MFKDFLKWHKKNYNFCCGCGKETILHQHHVKAVGSGNNRNKELPEHLTVIMLCSDCHFMAHNTTDYDFSQHIGINIYKQVVNQILRYLHNEVINKNLDEEFRNMDYLK